MSDPVRARDVSVERLYRPVCHRADCTSGEDGGHWKGELHYTYQDANFERTGHLTQHTMAQEET